MSGRTRESFVLAALLSLLAGAPAADAQLAVRAGRLHTMASDPIEDGVVLVKDGRIQRVGEAAVVAIPDGYRIVTAAVATPGLIDAHTVVGLAGRFNQDHDQDQIEKAASFAPELRALDAYNHREGLVRWLREHGVTTIHTGHAPGALVTGQSLIVKTREAPLAETVIDSSAMLLATLADSGRARQGKSPGTRAKMVAMLRAKLIKAREYTAKQERARAGGKDEAPPPRDLALEALADVLAKKKPMLVTAHRDRDILTALRLAREFGFELIVDGAAEAYLVLDELKAAGVRVILHPTMARARGDRENLSFETASKLRESGIPFALQSGYESYVPKTRVVLFEAALAAAHGLGREGALAAITRDAAALLGIADRVGTIEPGKDADLALFDGDPFEYTSHVTGVIIDGEIVSQTRR